LAQSVERASERARERARCINQSIVSSDKCVCFRFPLCPLPAEFLTKASSLAPICV
jgi:hypothetical protein